MDSYKQAVVLTALVSRMRRDSWCGETHVQKAAYVLQELLEVPLDFHFILYKFGPFSFDLRDELTVLRADGLLKLEPQAPPYGPRFAATDLSEDLRNRFPKTMDKHRDQIEFVAEALKNKRVAELERLVTALYVTREIEPGGTVKARADALVRQKPHVSSVEAEAAVVEIDRTIEKANDRFRTSIRP